MTAAAAADAQDSVLSSSDHNGVQRPYLMKRLTEIRSRIIDLRTACRSDSVQKTRDTPEPETAHPTIDMPPSLTQVLRASGRVQLPVAHDCVQQHRGGQDPGLRGVLHTGAQGDMELQRQK